VEITGNAELVLILCNGLLAAGIGVYMVRNSLPHWTWCTTTAKITSSKILSSGWKIISSWWKKLEDEDGDVMVVSYDFLVDGVQYSGKGVVLTKDYGPLLPAEKYKSECYALGRPITVRYNPRNPSRSCVALTGVLAWVEAVLGVGAGLAFATSGVVLSSLVLLFFLRPRK
jgi:hypothetical protein